ncbi:uncharacterized protein LOC107809232 [Nicotiana tabacum]|uniref:Uncharacterized protein LOC107809232 n=2 Tax=Nicotiana TaxID=4085 RepID=A0A1S4BKI8_TOBAC|nr:PREDICTED: uncharacterized protein LOC104231132 [Nicotiana sylvestris]XP_016489347.1 PREDICTED: uncharacterized protein LOC107809232 [Nicotiana tabacum]
MKAFVGFSVLFLTMVTALVCFVSYGKEDTSSPPGMSSTWQENNELAITIRSRKLQGNDYGPSTSTSTDEGGVGKINLEDYRPIDPVPSSKASVRPGPIQHGTPLMPYIPKQPPPPTRSKPVGFP